jgi:hypothetical protein
MLQVRDGILSLGPMCMFEREIEQPHMLKLFQVCC